MKKKILLFPPEEKWVAFHTESSLSTIASNVDELPSVLKRIYYKEYPRFKTIMLPPITDLTKKTSDVFLSRRSRRIFRKNHPTLSELSTLLFFSCGINPEALKKKKEFRFYPSAGARYPIETYLLTQNHKNLGNNLYHYSSMKHALEVLPYAKKTLNEYIGMANIKSLTNPSFIILTSVMNRTTLKYDSRGYRYALIEAGHIMQNIYLLSAALGIHSCEIGGFIDNKINRLLDLEIHKEQTISICALG